MEKKIFQAILGLGVVLVGVGLSLSAKERKEVLELEEVDAEVKEEDLPF